MQIFLIIYLLETEVQVLISISEFYQSALCLFIANVNLAFSSVLSQAIFVELGKLTYEGKNVGDTKDLVSVYFIVKNLGFVLAATLKGFLIELFAVETVFLINSLKKK